MKIALTIVAGTILALGVLVGSSLIGYNNSWVVAEQGLEAQYKQNQNNYDNMVKRIVETAQVPTIYTEDVSKIYGAALTGRYGENGSRAVLQFITEQNPQVEGKLYVQVQQVIEAGRQSFEADQKMLLDKRRAYQISLQTFPANLVASILGFPKRDLSEYDIVTSGSTKEAFDTKQAEPVKIR